jgi:cardiolipin synthase
MAADIDAAESSVHVCFYIWLPDGNGLKVKDALIRAAGRGVKVRVLADALGSRGIVRSRHWREMRRAGVDARAALPIGGLLWTLIRGRFDLRNHRKQLIIDNRIAWCGSQNLADPAFLPKVRYGPWVDVMVRWEGPVVQDCQFIFAADWESEHGDDISGLLPDSVEPASVADPGIAAQVIGTGPNLPYPAMTACFVSLIHAAREELIVTTPYFVPDEQLVFALMDCARRGVRTTIILPRRNDSWIVAATSRSYYADMVEAGVRIYEFRPGLLHAKTMVADGKVGLIGSANLDRRSFELNFENNILFADDAFAHELRERQMTYLAQSDRVSAEEVARTGMARRFWQNLLATLSPLL